MHPTEKIRSILSGWTNYAKGKTTPLSKTRAEICSTCPSAVHSKFLEWVGDDLEKVEGLVCSECHCPLSAKVRSKVERCDLGKW